MFGIDIGPHDILGLKTSNTVVTADFPHFQRTHHIHQIIEPATGNWYSPIPFVAFPPFDFHRPKKIGKGFERAKKFGARSNSSRRFWKKYFILFFCYPLFLIFCVALTAGYDIVGRIVYRTPRIAISRRARRKFCRMHIYLPGYAAGVYGVYQNTPFCGRGDRTYIRLMGCVNIRWKCNPLLSFTFCFGIYILSIKSGIARGYVRYLPELEEGPRCV